MIVVLNRDDPVSWQVMPSAEARIRRFCETFGTDSGADVIVAALRQEFVRDTPQMLCIVALAEDGRATGHILAHMEGFGKSLHAQVLQLEVDPGTSSHSDRNLAFRVLLGWAKLCGAQYLQGYVTYNHADRLGFWRRHGFREKYVMMRRPVEQAPATVPAAVPEITFGDTTATARTNQ